MVVRTVAMSIRTIFVACVLAGSSAALAQTEESAQEIARKARDRGSLNL